MSLSARFFAALGFFALYFFAQPAFAQTNMIAVISADQLGTLSHSDHRLSLPELWQSTLVAQVLLPEDQALNPQDVWSWESKRFAHQVADSRVRLKAGERYVARFSLRSARSRLLALEVPEPRLDAVHLSYRIPGQAWVNLAAGDRIAMSQWPIPDTHPSFLFDVPEGTVDVVIQIAHRGAVSEAAQLSEAKTYMISRVQASWKNGLLLSACLVLALVGLLSYLNNRSFSFLAITVLSGSMGLVMFFSSGAGGTFLWVDQPYFNDRSKLLVLMFQIMSMPLAFALALGLNKPASRWWQLSWGVMALGLLLALLRLNYAWRDYNYVILLVFSALVLLFISVR